MREGAGRRPRGGAARRVVHPRRRPRARSAKKPAGNLALRLLTAALLIPPVLWIIYGGGSSSLVHGDRDRLLGLHEFYQLIEQKGAEPAAPPRAWSAAAALPVVMYFGDESLATVLMTAVLLTRDDPCSSPRADPRGDRERLGDLLRRLLRGLAALARGVLRFDASWRALRAPRRPRLGSPRTSASSSDLR